MNTRIGLLLAAALLANVTTGRAEEKLFAQVIPWVSPAKDAPKELQLKADDKINNVQRVRAKIVHERRVLGDLIRADFQSLYNYLLDSIVSI